MLRENNRGAALLTLIMAIVIFGTLALAVHAFLSQNIASGVVMLDRARALYLAEAGTSDSFWELKYGEKLYGGSGRPHGQIAPRTVTFDDGSSGSYEAYKETPFVTSAGTMNGLERNILIEITAEKAQGYALFTSDEKDVTFMRSTGIAGDMYANGNVTIRKPTMIREDRVTLFLPEGNKAHYTTGQLFPFITVHTAPGNPCLDTSWYDALIARASAEPGGGMSIGSLQLGDSMFVNGDLTIADNSVVTAAAASSVVAVTGTITAGARTSIGDGIWFVAQDGITLSTRVTIGMTTGKSGNVCYAGHGAIDVGSRSTVNGSLIAVDKVVLRSMTRVNGLVYCGGTLRVVPGKVKMKGAAWVFGLESNQAPETTEILYQRGYVPEPLPPGLVPPGGTRITRVPNSWKEV